VVEHSHHYPKVDVSSSATTAATVRKKVAKDSAFIRFLKVVLFVKVSWLDPILYKGLVYT
jgi:hypothetical protein